MLIKNGTILDGTGKERYKADLRIKGDKIVEIQQGLSKKRGEKVLDAEGRFVAPGFIDILNHSDVYLTLFSIPSQNSLLAQGVTTILMGNCGASLAPLTRGHIIRSVQKWGDISKINVNWQTIDELLEELGRHPIGLNVGTQVGHATLRRGLVGDAFRELTQKELQAMQSLLEQGMQEGAFGLSSGLSYSHAKAASPEEIEALLSVVKKYNGFYATHIRDEADNFYESVKEALASSKKTGVSLEISHFKVMGKDNWGQFQKALSLMEKFKNDGLNVNFDVYPYTTTASVLYVLLPDWAAEGGKDKLISRLKDKTVRKKILEEMRASALNWSDVRIAISSLDPTFVGKTLGEISGEEAVSPEEAALNMLIASEDRVIVFTDSISPENLKNAVSHPLSFISSAGVGYNLAHRKTGDLIHPRYFGAFPRFLSTYVRQNKKLSWEEAVHKITGGPAEKIGLPNRGGIQKGRAADLVVFNPLLIDDVATFENPYSYPRGIDYVLVNGKVAVRRQKFKKEKAGQILRHK